MSIDRRSLLKYAATLPVLGAPTRIAHAASDPPMAKADYTLRIAPVSLELAPGKTITTTGYNGKVPGPVLRLREGSPVAINVINDGGYPDIVHWHGLPCKMAPPRKDRRSSRSDNRISIRSRRSRPAPGGITVMPWR
jgi:FtsP/CotA-like multicopper oxidase with cupredoxin domain